ncbi:phBC6A51 family helix-turn-helix protein [Bacillus sp. FJAT-52991]|uniref:PhBC6A51 family helix-turn-helix protein n=1 Tax=Bacillus kandeliae TaxID=3129297 RepID=A0ABZ2N8X6_9BACI
MKLSKRRLNEKQIAAITILAQPKRAGMTYDDVAKEVGVARSTVFEWKKQDLFCEELKKEIVRNTIDRLPEVMEAVPDIIIRDGNAAMLRTLLQAHGLLTDKVAVEQKSEAGSVDLDAMRADIKRMRSGK